MCGAEALALGLVNAVFPSRRELMEAAHTSIATIAARSPHAVAVCKTVLNAVRDLTTKEALDAEARGYRAVFEHRESKEGIGAFLGKRAPDSTRGS